jgi:hypothetical protein
MKIKIADDLSLPLDAVTQTFLIVGKRGSGKSNTAARLVEQFHRARLPFVVLDPIDTWWGLKAGRAGEKGLDVYVFGGRKADLPLNAGDGALIADVLCEHRVSMVLSVKHLSGRERSTFMVAFAQRLFQKWVGGPLHLVLEEAHELAPQSTQNAKEGEQQMLGAFKRLWKLGRSSGIGGSAITQRPASLSKDITTQSEILIAHRTIGPQDVKAVGEWVKYHGERLDILAELPTLPTGEAFVWAPEFPEGKPIGLVRTAILLRETYDSASTPKVGEQRVEPKELAPVDLDKLRAKMSATIEKAKAEDPRQLRRQIAELRTQLAAKPGATPVQTVVHNKIVERFVLKDGQLARVEKAVERLAHTFERHDDALNAFRAEGFTMLKEIAAAIAKTAAPQIAPAAPPRERLTPPKAVGGTPVRPPGRPARDASGNGHVSGAQQRILDALAELQVLGIPEAARVMVAFFAGYTHLNSKGFTNALGALSASGYLAYPRQGVVALTPAGAAIARDTNTPDSVAEAQERIIRLLGGATERILRPLIAAYPRSLPRDEVATAAGYGHTNSKGFTNALGRLRSLGFVDYPSQGQVVANPVLFLEGR